MKRKLLFGLILSAFIAVPVIAAVNVEETTEAEYLINGGYSQSTAEDVFILKNRIAGKPVEPLYEKRSSNKFVNFCKKFYAYLDPSQEEYDKLHHDINLSPSMTDL